MTHASKYFYGNKISDEGLRRGYVDYRTFSQAFNAVCNNNIIEAMNKAGYYFEEENTEEYYDNAGNYYTAEEAEERREEINARLEEIDDRLEELQEDEEKNNAEIKELESEAAALEDDITALDDPRYKDIFQYYIVSDNALELLREAGEAIYICEGLDLIVWGVDHWGTSWDYVMTNIKLNLDEE